MAYGGLLKKNYYFGLSSFERGGKMIKNHVRKFYNFRKSFGIENVTIIAIASLILLATTFPVDAAIQATSLEIRGTVANATALNNAGAGVSWDSTSFAGFWYELKTNRQTETLHITGFSSERTIDKANLWYNTTMEPVEYRVHKEKNRLVEYGLNESAGYVPVSTGGGYYNVTGWLAEKYVAINGKNNKLAKMVLEQGSTDNKTLATGETWDMGEGFTLTVHSINVTTTPKQVWLVLNKDGNKLDDKIVEEASSTGSGTQGVYTYNASLGNESNVPVFVTYVDSINASSNLVQLKYTWLISTSITEVKSGDRYGIFEVDAISPVTLKTNSSVTLSKGAIVDLAGGMKFRVADSENGDVRFYPFVERTTPGIWEVRGTVANATALNAGGNGVFWNSASLAGFWYDLKDNKQTETLQINAFSGERTIAPNYLWYNTTQAPIQLKVNSEKNRLVEYGLSSGNNFQPLSTGGGYYNVTAWLGQKYVAINGKNNKLAKLVLEQETIDKKTLAIGETWDMGDGFTLKAQSIDAKASSRQVWLVLSKDGNKLDDKIVEAASITGTGTQGVYTYYEKSLGGESNVPIFVTYVDSVFSGAISDMVQLKYTWLISSSITEIRSGDRYGVFQVDAISPVILKSSSSVTLSRDTVVDLASGMKFRVADSENGDVRFYPMVEYQVLPGGGGSSGGGGGIPDTLIFEPKAWNLVSVPKTLNSSSVNIAFENLSFDDNNVKWYYNASTNEWEHPSNILPLRSYWVYNNASYTIFQKLTYKNMSGPNLPPSMKLNVGWNLVGHTSNNSMSVESALISIKGKYSNLLTYSPLEGWKFYIVGNPSLQQFNTFEPGRGYWIFMIENATYAGVTI